jgi:hypothetical protein
MWRLLVVSVGLLVLVGCGSKREGTGTVKGTIKYKGQAVNGAALTLYPSSGNSVLIPVSQEGTFEVAGVPDGEYVVVVQPSTGDSGVPSTKGMDKAKVAEMQSKIDALKSPPTIPIPKKYTQRETSDLKLTVSKGSEPVELVLKD